MRLWGACLLVAGILMLVPLQSAVTACDCDFTATISLDDNLASELANETFLYTDLNLSDREYIKNILENSEKIQSILEYFGINEDGLLFNDSLVIMINETDRYVMVPLNLTTGNQWNVTVNVTNEETNETTPMTFVGDFAVVNAYISGGEVINAGWLEIEKIAGGLLYTISPDGNGTIDFATSDELGIGITSGGVTVAGVMWDTQNENSTNESATPPPQPTDWWCYFRCWANVTVAALSTMAAGVGLYLQFTQEYPARGLIAFGVLSIITWEIIKAIPRFIETHPYKAMLLASMAMWMAGWVGRGVHNYCLEECNMSAVAISSLSVDIYMAQNVSTIATISVEDSQGESLTGIVNSDGNVDVIEDES
ncbi:MAG: hypothetical protein J7K38_05765 [Thermoplasmata archaeon]|nr:hypothetical protein [Thermoplasmata archaeon]